MTTTLRRVSLVLCALLIGGVASAQVATDIALTRAQIQKDRQAIIAAAMPLTESEALAFWPAYRDYRTAMARVNDRLQKLITDFAATGGKLDDAQATTMLNEHMAIQADELSVRKKYVAQFRKLLPSAKVTRFFQLETKLDAVVRYELAQAIPLAR